jgi:CheY-like chemotaxis protein
LAGGLLRRNSKFQVEFASNGLEALEQIEEQLPLAVITDMVMPDLDGLGLVRAIRKQFPRVPVILMTAAGSEETAAHALLEGAADYVPKLLLAQRLVPAVEAVLAISGHSPNQQRLAHCLLRREELFELESDLLLVPPLVEHLKLTATDLGVVGDSDGFRLAKSLYEAISNAMLHGNLELSPWELQPENALPGTPDLIAQRSQQAPYKDRRVTVRTAMSRAEVTFTIADQGPGFNTAVVLGGKSEPTRLSEDHGRGLVLIHMFMDEVRFNAKGNEITLVKRRAAGGGQP